MANSRKGAFNCNICGIGFRTTQPLEKHKILHDESFRNVAWVECVECSTRAKTLGKHLTFAHKMTKDEYLTKHPTALLTCKQSAVTFKKRGKNWNWIKRANVRGDDLTKYKEKMGKAVSVAIMNDPEERTRRSQQMAINNSTPEARKRSSIAAIKTSARPEVQKARTKALTTWRNENFDEFFKKCVLAMHSTWQSKPEKILRNLIIDIDSSFKGNQQIRDPHFTTKSKRKQIDIMSKSQGVLVEFDGIIHFEPLRGLETLLSVQKRDAELDFVTYKQALTLIRVSYDQFSYKRGGYFKQDCLDKLFNVIKNPTVGVHYIGSSYNVKIG